MCQCRIYIQTRVGALRLVLKEEEEKGNRVFRGVMRGRRRGGGGHDAGEEVGWSNSKMNLARGNGPAARTREPGPG